MQSSEAASCGVSPAVSLHERPAWRVVMSIGIGTLINDHDELQDGVEHDPAQSLGEQFRSAP